MTAKLLRQYVTLNVAFITFLFALPALEALVLRRQTTLTSQFPYLVLVLAYAAAIALVLSFEPTRARRDVLITAGVTIASVATLLIGGALSRVFVDTSWDGLAYHQPAIYELRHGWNPIFARKDTALFNGFLWVNEYPKAAWFSSAVLTGVFGDIEAAKLSFFLGASAFAVALRTLLVFGVPLAWKGTIAALLLVLNPISIVQFWQFYIDGVVYFLLVVCVAQAVLYARQRDVRDLAVLFLGGIYLANLKFTGVIYFALILGWLTVDMMLTAPDRKRSIVIMGATFFAWLAAVGLTGFSPYIQHVLDGKHIFSPMMGAAKIDVITRLTPEQWRDSGWFMSLVQSHLYFARGKFGLDNLGNNLALYGTGSIGGVLPDSRVSGLGRFFWLAFLTSLVAAVIALCRRFSWRLLSALSALVVLAVFNPVAWWVRYIPLLWAVPIIFAVVATTLYPNRATLLLAGSALFLCAVTSQLYAGQGGWAQMENDRADQGRRAALDGIVRGAKEVTVATKDHASYIYWMRDKGVPVVWVPWSAPRCAHPRTSATLQICTK